MNKEAEALWNALGDGLPPDGELVETKIDGGHGERNVQIMKRQGRLWFVPGGMYVYYTPTHWRRLSKGDQTNG